MGRQAVSITLLAECLRDLGEEVTSTHPFVAVRLSNMAAVLENATTDRIITIVPERESEHDAQQHRHEPHS